MKQINLSHGYTFNSVLVIVLCFLFSDGISQDLPSSPDRWVEDYADILTPSQERDLNQMLRIYEDTTSNQILVAVFPDAQDYPVEEFSIRLAEKWLVGQKGRDNGIILAIFLREKKIRVEVGYGLEDVVPDAIAFQIADGVIPPYFREGKYYEGIQAGARALMLAATGKFEGIPRGNSTDGSPGFPFILLVVFLLIIISMFRRRKFSGAGSRGWTSRGPFFWGGMGGGRSSGGGGGFGGGFRGGGGGFGGGGATGSW